MGIALNKHSLFGFQIQESEGVQASNAIIWTPFNDTMDFSRKATLEMYSQADGTDYNHLMFNSGQWYDGAAPIALIPTSGTIAALIDWIQTRDAYNQGKFATVYLYQRDTGVNQAIVDTKVRTATFRFEKRRPVMLSLDLVGKTPGTTPAVGVCDTGGPYLWSEAVVTQDLDIGSLSETVDMETIEVTIDNKVQDATEGMRITSGVTPAHIYNTGDINCTGRFTVDYTDATLFNLFTQQLNYDFSIEGDVQLNIALARSAISLNLLVNRLKFTEWRGNPNGTNDGIIPQEITWQGLGSDDGTVPPITLS
jgi:hypothetical protein